MKIIVLLLAVCFGLRVSGQTFEEYKKRALSDFDSYKEQQQRQFNEYRDKANRQYAEFMRQAWQKYAKYAAIPKPQEKPVPPVVMPEEDWDKLLKDRVVPIEEVIVPPRPEPQPKPFVPLEEESEPGESYVGFTFLGTAGKVRFRDEEKFRLPDCGEEALAGAWEKLSGKNYNNILYDCLALRKKWHLCDWAYLMMLDEVTKACLGQGNEATLLMSFIFCQSGYKMRIGRANNKLYLLCASKHVIYNLSYFKIEDEMYYALNCREEQMDICDVAYPNEKSLSLLIPQEQLFAYDESPRRQLQSERYPEVKATVSVNKNLIGFYDSYPSSILGDNIMTRWAMYADVPLASRVREKLYPALRKVIGDVSQHEAANRLLNFVQTAFEYEYDDKVWGGDRAFFAEETLYYPYCDCEDRAILFSRLVRDLLGLDVVLVYYPGHLATAVSFSDNVKGDYILLNDRKFVVCDPTYIGAPVGMTMPGMDNETAKVIVLSSARR